MSWLRSGGPREKSQRATDVVSDERTSGSSTDDNANGEATDTDVGNVRRRLERDALLRERDEMVQEVRDLQDRVREHESVLRERDELLLERIRLHERVRRLEDAVNTHDEQPELLEERRRRREELESTKSELESTRSELESTRSELESKGSDLENGRAELAAKVEELERERDELSSTVAEIGRDRDQARRTERMSALSVQFAESIRANARRDAELTLRKARKRADAMVRERHQAEQDLLHLQALTTEARRRLAAFTSAALEILDLEVPSRKDGSAASASDLARALHTEVGSARSQTPIGERETTANLP